MWLGGTSGTSYSPLAGLLDVYATAKLRLSLSFCQCLYARKNAISATTKITKAMMPIMGPMESVAIEVFGTIVTSMAGAFSQRVPDQPASHWQ